MLFVNSSMLTCGWIIDVFCLDVTKCGEWLDNEENMKTALLRLVQRRCLDRHEAQAE